MTTWSLSMHSPNSSCTNTSKASIALVPHKWTVLMIVSMNDRGVRPKYRVSRSWIFGGSMVANASRRSLLLPPVSWLVYPICPSTALIFDPTTLLSHHAKTHRAEFISFKCTKSKHRAQSCFIYGLSLCSNSGRYFLSVLIQMSIKSSERTTKPCWSAHGEVGFCRGVQCETEHAPHASGWRTKYNTRLWRKF